VLYQAEPRPDDKESPLRKKRGDSQRKVRFDYNICGLSRRTVATRA
jgi:hypothetical protein